MKYLKRFEAYIGDLDEDENDPNFYLRAEELDPNYEHGEEENPIPPFGMAGEEEAGDEDFDDPNYVEGSGDLDYQWRKLLEDPEFVKKLAEKQKESEGQHVSKFDTFNNESTCPSCNCQECECDGMANEAKKSKSSYKNSGLKNPEKADLNKDKKLSGYEKTRGKAIQKSIEGEDEESPSKGKGKGKSEPSKKQKKGLPKELVDAMKKGLRD